jgi:hypothetical protein
MKAMVTLWNVLLAVCLSSIAFAGNNTYLTYQGRITKPDGSVVNSATVAMTVQILAPNGCVLWQESLGIIDMSSSNGAFSVTIGTGANTAAGALAWQQVFQNGQTYAGLLGTGCAGTYQGGPTDDRTIYATFNDGSGNQTVGPVPVKSGPYAQKASAANGAFGFLQVDNVYESTALVPTLTALDAGKVWFNTSTSLLRYWNGSTALTVPGTGAGGGSITNADISSVAGIDAAKLGGGSVDNTEYGYLDGATSNIQTQINSVTTNANGRVSTTGSTMTGNLVRFFSRSHWKWNGGCDHHGAFLFDRKL